MSIPLSDSEVLRERNDLEMMRRQHLWSHYFVLALKRAVRTRDEDVRPGRVDYRPGMLVYHGQVEGKSHYHFFEDVSIHSRELPEMPTMQGGDDLLVALAHDGWLVD